MVLAIHTVFILRENFRFLEEWIKYHLDLGFNHVYLYNNSNSEEYKMNFGGNNKYGIDFNSLTAAITDDQLDQGLAIIIEKFAGKITVVDWSPKNDRGEVVYAQKNAIIDYFERYSERSDWTAFIDVDEFIYCSSVLRKLMVRLNKSAAGSIILKQKKFMDRHFSFNKRVVEILDCIENLDTSEWGPKVILKNACFDQASAIEWGIHFIPVKNCSVVVADSNKLRFNHYNVNQKQLEWMEKYFETRLSFNARCYQLYNQVRRMKTRN